MATLEHNDGRLDIIMWRGDAFRELEITLENVDLTNAVLKMQIRVNGKTGPVVTTLGTETGEIVLTDPTNGKFTILPFSTDAWESGEYFYDLQRDGIPGPTTYFAGQIKADQDTTDE